MQMSLQVWPVIVPSSLVEVADDFLPYVPYPHSHCGIFWLISSFLRWSPHRFTATNLYLRSETMLSYGNDTESVSYIDSAVCFSLANVPSRKRSTRPLAMKTLLRQRL